VSTADGGRRATPRTLPGATVLQIVPSLGDHPAARRAADIAFALLRSGARAIVAGGDGPLVAELQGFGAEWVRLECETTNPLRLRANARRLEEFIAAERVDLIHAWGSGASRSAARAKAKAGTWLVHGYAHARTPQALTERFYGRALAADDRIIAHSQYVAERLMERHPIDRERVTVIPRRIDTGDFSPAAVEPERVWALRHAWKIRRGDRVILGPGRIDPRKGQLLLVDAARILVTGGMHNVIFVLAGDDKINADYAQAISERARSYGVSQMVRRVGFCRDMPAAYAAADVVAVPAVEPPTFCRVAAEAFAMARPVVASATGALPEIVLAPPYVPENTRIGWLAAPDDAMSLARALAAVEAVNSDELQTLGARARRFAEAAFAPAHVAAGALTVYSELFEGGDRARQRPPA